MFKLSVKFYVSFPCRLIAVIILTLNTMFIAGCGFSGKNKIINSNNNYQNYNGDRIFKEVKDNEPQKKNNPGMTDEDEYYSIDSLESKRIPSRDAALGFNFERDRNYLYIKWFISKNKYRQAEEGLIDFAAKNPDEKKYKEYYYYLGLIDENKGENIKAIQSYSEAIRICPEYSRAWNSLGYLYSIMKQYNRAESCFKKAVEYNPYNPFIQYNTGNFYYHINDYDSAIKYLKNAVRYKANFGGAYFKLGVIMYDRGKLREAVEHFNKAIRFEAESPQLYYYIGASYYKIDDKDMALKSLDKATALKADFFEAHIEKGRIYQDCGEYENAIAAYSKAERFAPDYRELKIWIAVCYGESGKYDKAINILLNILKSEPDSEKIKKLVRDLEEKKYKRNINQGNDYITY